MHTVCGIPRVRTVQNGFSRLGAQKNRLGRLSILTKNFRILTNRVRATAKKYQKSPKVTYFRGVLMLSHCWFSYYKHFRPCPSQRHKKIRGEVGGKKVDFTLQDIGSLSYNVNTVRTLGIRLHCHFYIYIDLQFNSGNKKLL